MKKISPVLILTISMLWSCSPDTSVLPGLIGIYYSEPNLESPKGITLLDSLSQVWDEHVDFQAGSSAEWKGTLRGPITGNVTLIIKTTTRVSLQVDGQYMEANQDSPYVSRDIEMKLGEKYPIEILFYYQNGAPETGAFWIGWEWDGQKQTVIGEGDLSHSAEQVDQLAWYHALDEPDFNPSDYLRAIDATHSVVYYEPGKFAAWPANHGIWSWEDEILVGFTKGTYRKNKYHHSLDQTKPNFLALARSYDGGRTWSQEENLIIHHENKKRLEESVNFAHPDLAIRNQQDFFLVSYDRGKFWEGPYQYPDFNIGPLTSRTDYIIDGKNSCNMFLSSKYTGRKADAQDRSFLARTEDGGMNFEFISWISDIDTLRSVMSSTVKVSDTHFISAMRRRYDTPRGMNHSLRENWIDVYESRDGGQSWHFLSKIAQTDRGRRNGNPPSLVRLSNGKLCLSYGYRATPYGIRARTSNNKGKTWSKEIIIRENASKWDLGYLRSAVLPDDRVVFVYYITTRDVEEQHIQATVWHPGRTEPY